MAKFLNQTIYRGRFSGLKLNAFGIATTVPWLADIEIYQARVSPQLWRARPYMKHAAHAWQSKTLAGLMEIIGRDFEEVIKPFKVWRPSAAPLTCTSVQEYLRRERKRSVS
jgi:hypothetical protein